MTLHFPEGRHPNREEARALLRECDDNREHIEEWNAYREADGGWKPDISDEGDRADLRKLILCYQVEDGEWRGINLSRAHLDTAKFDNGELRGAKLFCALLNGADLMGTNLSGADLRLAELRGAILLAATVSGADLRSTDLSDADVSVVQYERFALKGKCGGVRATTCHGHPIFKRDVEDQDFIDTMGWMLRGRRLTLAKEAKELRGKGLWKNRWDRVRNLGSRGLFRAWGWIDYGRSFGRVFVGSSVLVMLFGCIFAWGRSGGWSLLDYSASANTALTPFYFSLVTYTTLGFGDVTPGNWAGESVVMLEVLLGYLTLGLLVSILANKVARRS